MGISLSTASCRASIPSFEQGDRVVCKGYERKEEERGSVSIPITEQTGHTGDDGRGGKTYQAQQQILSVESSNTVLVSSTSGTKTVSRKRDGSSFGAKLSADKLLNSCSAVHEKDSLSTIARAAEERNKQGTHQLEISFGGELDLHKHYNSCSKNAGHHDFHPIKSLSKSWLPSISLVTSHDLSSQLTKFWWSVSSFCEYAAQLAVLLQIHYVSPDRFKIQGYPLSDHAGERVMTTGSGCVTDIRLNRNRYTFLCPLQNCQESSEPHYVFGYITITTAAHVVLDNNEAVETTVVFFDDHPRYKFGVAKAQGVKVRTVSVEGDFCELLCVTHSRQLYERLAALLSRSADLHLWFTEAEHSPTSIISGDWKYVRHFLVKWINSIAQIRRNASLCHKDLLIQTLEKIMTVVIKNFTPSRCRFNDPSLVAWLQGDPTILFVMEKVQWLLDNTESTSPLPAYAHNQDSQFSALLCEFQKILNYIGSQDRNVRSCSDQLCDVTASQSSLVRETYLKGLAREKDEYVFILLNLIVTNLCCYLVFHHIRLKDTLWDFNDLSRETENDIYDISESLDSILEEISEISRSIDHLEILIHSGFGPNREVFPLVIHFSHPHGQSKQVTFGTQVTCDSKYGNYKHVYTASTCHGGSGGPVWIIPVDQDGEINYNTIYGVPHGGCYDSANKLNHGCSWTFYPPQSGDEVTDVRFPRKCLWLSDPSLSDRLSNIRKIRPIFMDGAINKRINKKMLRGKTERKKNLNKIQKDPK